MIINQLSVEKLQKINLLVKYCCVCSAGMSERAELWVHTFTHHSFGNGGGIILILTCFSLAGVGVLLMFVCYLVSGVCGEN